MKDLIVISSHTPDFEREGLLRNFVNKIDTTNFDIMVVSHTRLPDDLYDKVNYFVFDKENELLTDLDSKYEVFWANSYFRILTTEARKFNHIRAAYKLFFVGISNAKALGYKKVHVVEYDTSLEDMSHFEENSKLLDDHSLVYYRRESGTPVVISFPMSFNLEKLNEEWFRFQKEEIIKGSFRTIEDWELEMIGNQNDTYAREYKALGKGITINLYASFGKEVWHCPVVDEEGNLRLFINNEQENSLHIQSIVNGKQVVVTNTKPNMWGCVPLGKYEDINSLLMIKDSKEIIKYNFDEIGRESYKSRNVHKNIS